MSNASRWIACASCAYPLYLAGVSAVSALPALVESLLPGHQLIEIGFRRFALFAMSDPAPATVTRIACALFVAAMIVWLMRRCLPSELSLTKRMLYLIAGFVLPIAIVSLFLFPLRTRAALPALVIFAIALIAAFPATALRESIAGWKMTALGCILTIALAFAAPQADAALRSRRRAAEMLVAQSVMAALPDPASATSYETRFFQRGVSLTAEWPAGYASEKARETLRMMPSYGVNAVALVPYGSIRSPRPFAGGGMESESGMEILSRVAHSIGVKIMLKPQLWGETWPADFEVSNEAARRVWFDEYTRFIVHYAQLATRMHADMFCIGTELAKMTRYENEWRTIIAQVRSAYTGPLTYDAIQGTEFETLRFWDALDYIGLSNYYPLPDGLDAGEIVSKVEAVQKRFDKPVIFAEAGFSSYSAPHRAPWDETPRTLSTQDQAACYDAVYRAFYRKPWFQGMYWWKVGTNRYGGASDGSHTPWGKPAMDVMKRWYLTGGR